MIENGLNAAYMFGTHSVVAGMRGTPVGMMAQGVTSGLASAFGDDEAPKQDADTRIRNFLADLIGADAAEVVARGDPRAVGIDVSKRMSINPADMWKDFLRYAGIGDESLTTAPLALQILGVAGAPFAGFYDAQHMRMGQTLRAAEAMSPKFARDAIRAYRFSQFGLEDRRGNLEIAPSQFG